MQQLEHGGLQPSLVSNMVVQHGLPGPCRHAAACWQERLDDFPGEASWTLPRTLSASSATPPQPQGPPATLPCHQHLHHPELVHQAQPLALPQAAWREDGEMDDVGGKHCCRWIDCSALSMTLGEELVRHIERIHID